MSATKYQVVRRISEVIAQTGDPWEGLSKVTRIISEYAGGASCLLFAYQKHTEKITLVAAHGENESLAGKLTFPSSIGLTGLAIRTGKILNYDNADDFSADLYDKPRVYGSHQGILIVPLIIGGSPIGTIDLTRPKQRKFSQRILDTIQEIATPLAMFIVNAMLSHQGFDAVDTFALRQSPQKIQWPADKPMRGNAITGGVVCGHVMLISGVDELLSVKRLPPPVNTTPEEIEAERQLYYAAMDYARRTAQRTAKELSQTLAEADSDIFTMHAMLIDDPTVKKTILKHIDDGYSITTALAVALRTFTAQYMKIEDQLLRERLCDIKDVMLNLKTAADNIRGTAGTGLEVQTADAKRIIVVAKELLPSQLVGLPLKKITGIICEDGGSTSHVAILARALQKTMMVGLQGIRELLDPGDSVLLDCDGGNCFLRPSMAMMRKYSGPLRLTRERLLRSQNQPDTAPHQVKTADGTEINFAGNLALLSELPAIQHYGLNAIGLYRTEFMFMIRNELPTEAYQYGVLRKLATWGDFKFLNVRLLDAGGDKPLPYLDIWNEEDNPSLGLRGLRFLLSHRSILKPHLRAILRAAAGRKVNILIPMVADLFDLLELKKALELCAAELDSEGLEHSRDYKLGIMIELPSAVAELDRLLPHIDFVSIGTNDLVQFLFAVDRGNPKVRQWYRQSHPLILRLIREICRKTAKYPGKTVGICGELAGSKRALPLLLGAGLRNFSMTPSRSPVLKQLVSRYSIPECEKLLDEVLDSCCTEMDVMAFLAAKGIES